MKKGIRVIKQRKEWDCGVASIAMLAGFPYGDVAAALRNLFPDCERLFRKRGLILTEMVALAAEFNLTLIVKRRAQGYIEGETGVLTLKGERFCSEGHYVVLKDGTHIVDPDAGEMWNLDEYLSRHGVRTVTLLARRT